MDNTLAALTDWMPRQRWFSGKGRIPKLAHVARWTLPPVADARAEVLLVADRAGTEEVVYQIPLVRRKPTTAAAAGEIARTGDECLIDGATDPAYQALLLAWVTRGGGADGDDGALVGVPSSGALSVDGAAASLLEGEQSNTSLIFRPTDGSSPVICKIFRQVAPGLNPDIELQSALAQTGAVFVPPVVGALSATWRRDGVPVEGSLAFAQEFFPGVEDAWRVALRAAREGTPFTAPAAALGRAVAGMIDRLSRVFPTRPATDNDRAAIAAGWRERLAGALRDVPEVAGYRSAIEAAYARALAAPWPELQRVHGDLHLGQVLDVPGRGWVLLDFEGEPLRPLAERRQPDLAVRDVAGMLRSFAYAADALTAEDRVPLRAWAADARAGFLEGYGEVAASPLDADLLRALEIDKSVYQAGYDARNRPEWTPIPLAAIAELTTG